MKNEITLSGITYQIEGDRYNGDILLTSPSQDLTIKGGYTELSCRWFDKDYKTVDYTGGIFKPSLEDYLSENIEQYIKETYHLALITVNQ